MPLFVNLPGLAIDNLLDLLGLLVKLDKLSLTNGGVVWVFAGASADNVPDSVDILCGSVDEAVLGLEMATRNGLALDLGGTGHVNCKGWLLHLVQRHDT